LPDIPTNTLALVSNSTGSAITVGTNVGVYFTIDGGQTWAKMGTSLPDVQVVQLVYNSTLDTLTAGTHGRSIWQITPSLTGVGVAANITVSSGSPQSAMINTAFAQPLVVLVKDNFGNPVSGATVTFTAPALTGASGTFGNLSNTITGTTDANGMLSESFTADGTAGGYTVTASINAGVPASFSLFNTTVIVVGDSITVSSGSPQSTAVSTAFAQPLVALVQDSSGNPVAGLTVTFTAPALTGASGTFSNGSNTITGTTDANGLLSESFTADGTAGTYTVTASIGAGSPASFSLSNTTSGGGGGGITGNVLVVSTSDIYEPNNTSDTATNFGQIGLTNILEYQGLQIANTAAGLPDYDWYKWQVQNTGWFTAVSRLTAGSNLEIHLFTLDANNTLVDLADNTSGATTERVWTAVTAGEQIYVEVKGKNIALGTFGTGTYTLDVQNSL
jgi:hypothetical protein